MRITNTTKRLLGSLGCCILLCLAGDVAAQQVNISGTVVSAGSDQPLQGVAFTAGGKTVCITNAKGVFNCTVTDTTRVLRVVLVGYAPYQLKLGSGASQRFTIQLSPTDRELEGVVVSTGYQTIPKERATGSFEVINKTAYNRRVSTDVLTRIEGLAPSLLFDRRTNPNSDVNNITIRGISTINSPKAPLVVLDGFPFEGDLDNINPDDVESITLLKDAAAASIWGVQAGNGVIVITTKKGSYRQPLRINFNMAYTIREKPDLMRLPEMSSNDFINTELFLFEKGFYNADIANTTNRPPLTPVVEILAKQRSGAITQQEATAMIDALRGLDIRNDMLRYLYRTGVSRQLNLQLSAGGADNHHLVSIGYNSDETQLKGNAYRRLTLRTDNMQRLGKRMELRYTMQYVASLQHINRTGWGTLRPGSNKAQYYPYARLADDEGNPLPLVRDYRLPYIDTAGGGRLLDWHYKPVEELDYLDNTERQHDLLLSAALKYNAGKGLDAELSYQYEGAGTTLRNHQTTELFFTRNQINRLTQLTPGGIKYVIPNGAILDRGHSWLDAHALRTQVNYNRAWQHHRIAALGGAEVRQNATRGDAYRIFGYDDNTLTFVNTDVAGTYPVYGGLAGMTTVPSPTSMTDQLYRYVSVFMNAAYTFANRYTVSVSARKDASNIFGVKSNQKGVPLWSAGAAWDIAREQFYRFEAIPRLRLRVTYGYSGNTDNNRSAYTTINFSSNAPNTNLPNAAVVNPPNPSLRWEKVNMLNMGVDFGTKNKRVTGSIEYYQKHAKDLFSSVPIDPTTGRGSVTINTAELKGRGVDITLSGIIVRRPFEWQSALMFSYVRNIVHKYYNLSNSAASHISSGLSINPREGLDAFSLYSYRWAGLDPATGDPMGYLNGTLSKDYLQIASATKPEDLVYHGTAIPKYYGAWRNTVSYKGFSIAGNITYRLGYFFRRSSIEYNRLYSQWVGHADFAHRWMKPGDEQYTNVPSMPYPVNSRRDDFYNQSEVLVERADNIRLQDLSLSYTTGKPQWKAVPFSSLECYVFVAHPGLLWKASKSTPDPDNDGGVRPARSVSIGLRASL